MNAQQVTALEKVARRRFEHVELLATDHKDDYLLSVSDGAFHKVYGGPTDYYEEFPEDRKQRKQRINVTFSPDTLAKLEVEIPEKQRSAFIEKLVRRELGMKKH